MSDVKQVIVMRSDLGMRKGKIAAQSAHASMAALLNPEKQEYEFLSMSGRSRSLLTPNISDDIEDWLNGSFTKVCLKAESEDILLDIYSKAKDSNLRVALIQDSGKTEFGGVPTYTCIAIGPHKSKDIDKITGHMKLY